VIADQTTSGFKFRGSQCLIPIMVLCFAGGELPPLLLYFHYW
jgi:hypothetical protein